MLDSARKLKQQFPTITKIQRYRPDDLTRDAAPQDFMDTQNTFAHSVVISQEGHYFALLKKLGSGAYGVVKRALGLAQETPCAAKIENIQKTTEYYQNLLQSKLSMFTQTGSSSSTSNSLHTIDFEAKALAQIQMEEDINKKLGRFHGSLLRLNRKGERKKYLFMDFIDAKNLHDQNHRINTIWQQIDVCLMLLQAVQDLHRVGYYHADLNLWNLLFQPAFQEDVSSAVYLIDFGCAIPILSGTVKQDMIRGTHLAPELLQQDEETGLCRFDEKAEVFALGMVCYEILTKNVFDAYHDKDFLDYKKSYQAFYQSAVLHLQALKQTAIDPAQTRCLSLVESMVQADSSKRIGLANAINLISGLREEMQQASRKATDKLSAKF